MSKQTALLAFDLKEVLRRAFISKVRRDTLVGLRAITAALGDPQTPLSDSDREFLEWACRLLREDLPRLEAVPSGRLTIPDGIPAALLPSWTTFTIDASSG